MFSKTDLSFIEESRQEENNSSPELKEFDYRDLKHYLGWIRKKIATECKKLELGSKTKSVNEKYIHTKWALAQSVKILLIQFEKAIKLKINLLELETQIFSIVDKLQGLDQFENLKEAQGLLTILLKEQEASKWVKKLIRLIDKGNALTGDSNFASYINLRFRENHLSFNSESY